MNRQRGLLIMLDRWMSVRGAAGRMWPHRLGSPALLLVLLAACASGGATSPEGVERGMGSSPVDTLLVRAERLARLWEGVEEYHESEIAPLERVLLRYREDPALVRRIAWALTVEARRVGVEPRLLLAVLLVENPWLDPTARSPVGAVGLMQVMPRHRGGWPPCAPDLEDVESNICHGARIFSHYFHREGGDVERALLRYNGCVRGTNTPDCHLYPNHVYARAGRASILAWLRPAPTLAASP